MDAQQLVQPTWGPLTHIQRGLDALTPEEQAQVQKRLDAADTQSLQSTPQLVQFFTFLAQVETIAIEIPLRFMESAEGEIKALLRAQLCDEVYHSALFAKIAHELSWPNQPAGTLASADVLLDQIRDEQDPSTCAAMLNLVAEGWIETVFRHASSWGVADAIFLDVLEDEARHVEEAHHYLQNFDPTRAQRAVKDLEQGLLKLSMEPAVNLAMHHLAGAKYPAFVADLQSQHAARLATLGTKPSKVWDLLTKAPAMELPRWSEVPSSQWRQAAMQIWDPPRSPALVGSMDLPVGHIPKKLLTPVLVAAVARAWHRNPHLSRICHQGKIYQIPNNVGVRVVLDNGDLGTVVVRQAHRLGVKDIGKLIVDGLNQLNAVQDMAKPATNLAQSMEVAAPEVNQFSVAVSNAGKFGLEHGTGAFTGEISPSTDLTIGLRRKRPAWKAVAYVPSWHVTVGALQDHRVFDADGSGDAMRAIRAEMTPKGVASIMHSLNVLPELPTKEQYRQMVPPELAAIGVTGSLKVATLTVAGAAVAAGAVGAAVGIANAQNAGRPEGECPRFNCLETLTDWHCPTHGDLRPSEATLARYKKRDLARAHRADRRFQQERKKAQKKAAKAASRRAKRLQKQ